MSSPTTYPDLPQPLDAAAILAAFPSKHRTTLARILRLIGPHLEMYNDGRIRYKSSGFASVSPLISLLVYFFKLDSSQDSVMLGRQRPIDAAQFYALLKLAKLPAKLINMEIS
jgi:hypothetical protein